MTDFATLLNPEQFAAATAGDGPLLVLAAAGTGKTRTLVHRVAYLVERGVPADRILLLTFTNRAAREMLSRAQALSGDKVSSIWSGTFHSICARLLRRYGASLGYPPSFSILDEEDRKRLLAERIKAEVADPKEFVKKEILSKMISEAVNEGKTIRAIASRWQTKVAGVRVDLIEKIAALYEARKRELAAMDFDDLLVNGLRLLEENESVRALLQEHFLHVLVDEYQDTNGIQAKFSDLLAAKHRNIMAVGDDFQCIYTWRGAQIENIMDFPTRWENCKIVKLERNYRSVPDILDVANAVMSEEAVSFAKTLRASRPSLGAKPQLISVYDGKSQAMEVAQSIRRYHAQGFRLGDMAVLYRSHFHSMDLQVTLTRENIPFRLTSGVGIFEQAHVKDTLAFLRLLVNPLDELSFLRFVSLLPGVGEKGAKKMWEKLSFRFDATRRDDREALLHCLPAKAVASAGPLWRALECAEDHFQENALGEIIEDFCDLFYESYLVKEWGETDGASRLDDVKELAVQIGSFKPEEEGLSAKGHLESFLADVALLTNLDARRNNLDNDQVTLSTIHQAKGMEWPVVFLPWLSAGMFPSPKATEEGRLDEERRLFYVAVTRAKDALSILVPRMRNNPDGGAFPVEPSEFVKDIPKELFFVRTGQFVAPPPRFSRPYRRW